MTNLFNIILYEPMHNALVYITAHMPGGDVGLAIIILTIIVRIIIFPLSHKAAKSQMELKRLEPELAKIKVDYKDKKEEQAKKTFELYKQNKINPFSSCILLLIQLPIIIALYRVFLKGVDLDGGTLYAFVKLPEAINTNFLGLIDLEAKSIVIALLAGASQFIQAYLTIPAHKPSIEKGSFKEEFAKNMNTQMKYFFPIMVTIIAYQISAAVALYWLTSNIFMIAQELYIRRKIPSNTANLSRLPEVGPRNN